MIGAKRTLLSIFVSLVLVGTAGASVWLMASAGVFTGAEQALPSAPGPSGTAPAAPGGGPISPGVQVAQPRDPFQPLITAPEGGEGGTTTTGAGGSTTTVPGGSTTTVPGGSTTTTNGDTPDGIRVKLLEVRDTATGRLAVIEVDGETYAVRVGETFATSFKVVSLTANGGVFTYGDSAFTLAVGQSILK